MRRRTLLLVVVMAAWTPSIARSQDTQFRPIGQQIPAPACMSLHNAWEGPAPAACTPETHQQWLADLEHWRMERRIRITYDPARYELPALKWTQSSFMQPQMMVQDR
ncbi:MAG TPA: formylglycine-generating enzyme family protein, partial [Terriglobia bacterium]|nr:formylglycine-generating enzyme family protein [Terriglobia bacterium]